MNCSRWLTVIKLKRVSPRPRHMDLTPLIDIIFNLLIFFLITAVLSAKGIDLDLPEADSSEKMPPQSIEVLISASGKISINRQQVPWADFKRLLVIEKKAGKTSSRKVILKAEKQTPFRHVVKVLDAARMEGFTNLVIATDNPPVPNDEKK